MVPRPMNPTAVGRQLLSGVLMAESLEEMPRDTAILTVRGYLLICLGLENPSI